MGTSVANSYSYSYKKMAGKSSFVIIIWYTYLKNRTAISLICRIFYTPGINWDVDRCQILISDLFIIFTTNWDATLIWLFTGRSTISLFLPPAASACGDTFGPLYVSCGADFLPSRDSSGGECPALHPGSQTQNTPVR